MSELVVFDARTGAERRSVSIKGHWSEVAWLDQLGFSFLEEQTARHFGSAMSQGINSRR